MTASPYFKVLDSALSRPRPSECEATGEHQGDTYPVATIDGKTGWHWTCCDDIDDEER